MIKYDNKLLLKKLSRAKETGAVELTGMEICDIPDEILNFENLTIEGQNWWQASPLLKINLSHNKIKYNFDLLDLFQFTC